ncbi:MAG: zf-HC2 domain-containing protein [bacterium]
MKHVQDKIQAYCDGELSTMEAAAVREHCAGCAECGRILRETEAVWRLVAASRTPELAHSTWPSLQSRLEPRVSRWARYALTGGAVAATAAGLILGIWLGEMQPPAGDSVWSQPSLIESGALLVSGSQQTLDELYLAADIPAGEETP